MRLPTRIVILILLLASLGCLSGAYGELTQTSVPQPTVASGTRQYTLVRLTKSDGALAHL